MRTVYKYPLETMKGDTQTIEMPRGAEVLHFDVQNGLFCLWALVEPAEPMQPRCFRVAGTGHPIEDEQAKRCKFIGTAFTDPDGTFVFHAFEILIGSATVKG